MNLRLPPFSIKGYVSWLIAVILGVFSLATGYLYWHDRYVISVDVEINYYHLETSQQCARVKEEIQLILHHLTLLRLGRHEPLDEIYHGGHLPIIKQEFKKIISIQERFQNVASEHLPIVFILEKAKRQMHLLQEKWQLYLLQDNWQETVGYESLLTSVSTNLKAFHHTMGQLQRLHIMDKEKMLSGFSGDKEQHDKNLLIMVAVLLTVGSFLVYRILTLITVLLVRQEESELRFRSVTQSVIDAIIAADESGKIIFWNEGARCIFGYTEEEISGRPISILMPAKYRPSHKKSLEKVLATGHVALTGQVVERIGVRKGGQEFPIEVSFASWLVGGKRYFSSVIRDITGRWQANQERMRQETDLQQAKEAAERANRAKSDFLSTMSHEIRTPMNGVLGMTELLLDMPLPKDAQNYLVAIRSSGRSLLGILNDILDFSKIEAGKIELEEINFHLFDLLENLTDFFVLSATERGITFRKILTKELPNIVLGDPIRLRQILTNLISNAIKFTDKGEVTLLVKPVAREDVLRETVLQVAFQIKDTGIGIKPEHFSKLFKLFEQADNSTTRQFGGTGLGLAITHRLTTLMRGGIEVDSHYGQGSVFTVTLPFILPSQHMLAQEPVHSHAPDTRAIPKGAGVLIVEDDGINRAVIHGMLRPYDLRLDFAESGRQALEKLEAKHYDLVFMDCQMPELDGFAACQAFRGMEQAREDGHTPVVALTAYALKGDRKRCLAAGMDDYMTKPIDRLQLAAALVRWLVPKIPSLEEPESLAFVKKKRMEDSVDQEALDILREDLDDSDFDGIVTIYLDTLPTKVAKMRAALDRQDLESLARVAHPLKSSSRQLGAMKFGALCEKLECLGRSGFVGQETELLASLEKEAEYVQKSLMAAMMRPV